MGSIASGHRRGRRQGSQGGGRTPSSLQLRTEGRGCGRTAHSLTGPGVQPGPSQPQAEHRGLRHPWERLGLCPLEVPERSDLPGLRVGRRGWVARGGGAGVTRTPPGCRGGRRAGVRGPPPAGAGMAAGSWQSPGGTLVPTAAFRVTSSCTFYIL